MLNLRIQYNESLKFGDIEPVLKKLSFIEVQITNFNDATSIEEVLGHEGSYTKNLYKKTATFFRQTEFKKNGESLINKRLNIVNSMIYSLASLTLHSLNINTCLSVLHGRTNQDSLVYDLADLFKGLLLPYAFLYSIEKQMKYFIKDDQEFRMKIIEIIEKENLLNQMFKTMIELTDAFIKINIKQ
jgi:CRISPR-associated endonuclease Cas1 subtype I-F